MKHWIGFITEHQLASLSSLISLRLDRAQGTSAFWSLNENKKWHFTPPERLFCDVDGGAWTVTGMSQQGLLCQYSKITE